MKWRFHGRDTLSFGTRVGIDVPTGDSDKGLGSGKVGLHALVIATHDAGAMSLHANVGYLRSGAEDERRSRWLASVAAVWPVHERAMVTLDVAATSNTGTQRKTPPAVARAGAILTVVEGFDVDAAYQVRLNRAAPERALVVGATLRW